jgi:hypothetical protein
VRLTASIANKGYLAQLILHHPFEVSIKKAIN